MPGSRARARARAHYKGLYLSYLNIFPSFFGLWNRSVSSECPLLSILVLFRPLCCSSSPRPSVAKRRPKVSLRPPVISSSGTLSSFFQALVCQCLGALAVSCPQTKSHVLCLTLGPLSVLVVGVCPSLTFPVLRCPLLSLQPLETYRFCQ